MIQINGSKLNIKQFFSQIFEIEKIFIYYHEINYYIIDLNNLKCSYIVSQWQQKQSSLINQLLLNNKKIYTNTTRLYKYLNLNKQSQIYNYISSMLNTGINQNVIDFIKQKLLTLSMKLQVVCLQYNPNFNVNPPKSRMAPLLVLDIITQKIQETMSNKQIQEFEYIYNLYGVALYLLQKQKININKERILEQFGFDVYKKLKHDYISQQLNMSPNNSRPTSTENKLNMLTVKKSGNKRSCFIPSTNKMFLLFDYVASNITLICKLIQYKTTNSIYQKLYSLLQIEDQKQLQLSKKKNTVLKIIYSSELKKYKQIEFYKSVYTLSQVLYQQYKSTGYIYSYISQKKIILDDKYIKKNVLLNRFIMNLQTQINLFILFCILVISQNKSYDVLLYIYDSFLMQFNKETIVEDFNQIQPIVTMLDQLNITISIGSDYKSIKKVELN